MQPRPWRATVRPCRPRGTACIRSMVAHPQTICDSGVSALASLILRGGFDRGSWGWPTTVCSMKSTTSGRAASSSGTEAEKSRDLAPRAARRHRRRAAAPDRPRALADLGGASGSGSRCRPGRRARTAPTGTDREAASAGVVHDHRHERRDALGLGGRPAVRDGERAILRAQSHRDTADRRFELAAAGVRQRAARLPRRRSRPHVQLRGHPPTAVAGRSPRSSSARATAAASSPRSRARPRPGRSGSSVLSASRGGAASRCRSCSGARACSPGGRST